MATDDSTSQNSAISVHFGKSAIVTGGGSGIGRGIAELLCLHGAQVAVFDVSEAGGKATVEACIARGGQAQYFHVDVSNENRVKTAVAAVCQLWGKVDILVNNAAAFVFGTVEDATSADWDKVLTVNVKGYAFMMRAVLSNMRERKSGSIVNIASTSAFMAQPAFVPYNTSKGAILQLTRCVALDVGRLGIRVNAVCPGPIDTPATSRHAAFVGRSKRDILAEMGSGLFLPRVGKPQDIADAALFLASRESSFITGECLVVDGGLLAASGFVQSAL